MCGIIWNMQQNVALLDVAWTLRRVKSKRGRLQRLYCKAGPLGGVSRLRRAKRKAPALQNTRTVKTWRAASLRCKRGRLLLTRRSVDATPSVGRDYPGYVERGRAQPVSFV
jgi:hypothetical protein